MSEADEWEYVVCGYRGIGLYFARSLDEARRGIAREQARCETKPRRTIKRRRKAGPWEPVSDPQRRNGGVTMTTECTCKHVQDRYADGSWARSYSLDIDPSCPHHTRIPRNKRLDRTRKSGRSVRPESLTMKHLGRHFPDVGQLIEFRCTADGWVLIGSDATRTFEPDASIPYADGHHHG